MIQGYRISEVSFEGAESQSAENVKLTTLKTEMEKIKGRNRKDHTK